MELCELKGFTDYQLARILEDICQASTTPDHTSGEEIVKALKQITDGAIEVLDNKKIIETLKNHLSNFDENRDKYSEMTQEVVDFIAKIVWKKT